MISAEAIADLVIDAARRKTMNAPRTQQAVNHVLGPSDLGGCREYLRRMVLGEPFDADDDADPRWPAFIGTAVGEHLEHALGAADPATRTQVPLAVVLPSGRQTRGTCDLVLPQHDLIGDLKAKDGLATVRRAGPSFENLVQINLYLLGAIQAGLVSPDAHWALIYYDRSGREHTPHVVVGQLDLEIIAQMEARLDDVEYAVTMGEETVRDLPEPVCRVICSFYAACRGTESDAQGLISDPGQLDAVEQYRQGQALEKEGARMKDEAKQALRGVTGSTGQHTVRWVDIGPTTVPTSTRSGYSRLDVRKIRGT
jgi:hypothetical protein